MLLPVVRMDMKETQHPPVVAQDLLQTGTQRPHTVTLGEKNIGMLLTLL